MKTELGGTLERERTSTTDPQMPLDRSIRWLSEHEKELNPQVMIFMSQQAYLKCNRHVQRSLDRELGGMLVGNSYHDREAKKHYIVIEDALEAAYSEVSAARLVFSSESQLELLKRLEKEFPGQKLTQPD